MKIDLERRQEEMKARMEKARVKGRYKECHSHIPGRVASPSESQDISPTLLANSNLEIMNTFQKGQSVQSTQSEQIDIGGIQKKSERYSPETNSRQPKSIFDLRIRSIEEAVEYSKPKHAYKLRKSLFTLARALRSYEDYRTDTKLKWKKIAKGYRVVLTEIGLRNAFDMWYAEALVFFLRSSIKNPKKIGFSNSWTFTVMQRSLWKKAQFWWPGIWRYKLQHHRKHCNSRIRRRFLITLCSELQKLVEHNQPIYMSCRVAQHILSLDGPNTAAQWLQGLVVLGYLEVVEKGGPETCTATRYRYVGGKKL